MSEIKLERDKDGLVRDATQSSIKVKPKYTPEDIADIDYDEKIGDPGSFPFTRGLYENMYRDRLWLKSFIVSYATPEETNEAFKSYIKNGLNDLRLLADLPTQSGIDPDHPAAYNSMMCGGVAVYGMPVFDKMLEGLPLEGVTYELAHSNVSSSIYSHACLVAKMKREGLDPTKLRGNGICDPIRAILVYGSPDWPTEINRQICIDHVEYTIDHTPKWKAAAPNGVDPQQAGMPIVQEVGEVIAVQSAIIADLEKRGKTIDDYGPVVVALDSEIDFFETICKFRAARRLWAEVARNRFGAKTKRAQLLKIGIRTSGLSLQKQKPLNNAARITMEILASVLGGVNSLDASSFDEAIGLPSEEARMFNLDTQHIITHEAGIPLVSDPLGGSYYVEALTNYIVEEVYKYLDEIEER
ncbi:MAG: acyl-CoA mutase large subunit family protein, partial [Firmicutes bacterium]|nr:acyl-CoA mutase large subunit family protein [Bacillota bacterium]